MSTQTVYKVVRNNNGVLQSTCSGSIIVPQELIVTYIPNKFVRSTGYMPNLFAFENLESAQNFVDDYPTCLFEIWKCEAIVSKKEAIALFLVKFKNIWAHAKKTIQIIFRGKLMVG